MFKYKIIYVSILIYFFSGFSYASSETAPCVNMGRAAIDGGCIYTPSFDRYKYNGEFGSMHVRHFPSTAGSNELNEILFLVSPFDNPYLEINSDSSEADEIILTDHSLLMGTLSFLVSPTSINGNVSSQSEYKEVVSGQLAALNSSGIDVVVFSWPDRLADHSIQKKSLALSSFLKGLQDYRFDLHDENLSYKYESIIGLSLGGVIARAALVDLENMNSNYIEYYISYDSPHMGANIPVSLQYVAPAIPELLMRGLKDNDNSLTQISSFFEDLGISKITDFVFNWDPGQYGRSLKDGKSEISEAISMLRSIDAPSINQLLINNMNSDGSSHPDFNVLENYLDDLGWPNSSINIAISNGIGEGEGALGRRIDVDDARATSLGYENFIESKYLIDFKTERLDSEIEGQYRIFARPVTEVTNNYWYNWYVYFRYTDMGVPRQPKRKIMSGGAGNSMPIDGGACSYSLITAQLGELLSSPESPFGERWGDDLLSGSYTPPINKTCFIPTASSLGISNQYAKIDYGPYDQLSPFDLYYTAHELEEHLYVSQRNYDVMEAVVSGDIDGDGLRHYAELGKGTDPLLSDTDGDGIPDDLDSNNGSGGNTVKILSPKIKPAERYTVANRIWASDANANQYCLAKGYERMKSWSTACGSDEDTFSEYNGHEWVERDSGSKDRCYSIIGSVTCELDLTPEHVSPKVRDIFGQNLAIWASHDNAVAYCRTLGYQSLDFYTQKCGEDEETYASYSRIAGEDDKVWVGVDSGSSNRLCYDIIEGISCN